MIDMIYMNCSPASMAKAAPQKHNTLITARYIVRQCTDTFIICSALLPSSVSHAPASTAPTPPAAPYSGQNVSVSCDRGVGTCTAVVMFVNRSMLNRSAFLKRFRPSNPSTRPTARRWRTKTQSQNTSLHRRAASAVSSGGGEGEEEEEDASIWWW